MPKAPSRYLLLPIVLSAALGACANNSSQPGSASATDETKLPEEQVMPQTRLVTGSIGYRERIALPPGSVAQVKLSDVSRADAPAAVLAEQTITLIGTQVPVPFELDVEPRMFDARMRYSVSAQIRSAEGALLWTTDTSNPIDVSQRVNNLGLLNMVKVSGRVADDAQIVDVSALLPLQASGNEPGWTLEMDTQRIALNRQGETATQLTPTPSATMNGQTYQFDATNQSNQLRVEVTPQLCRDSMTGMPHPYRVTVHSGDTRLEGCGGAAQSLLTAHPWQVVSINGNAVDTEHPASLQFSPDGLFGGKGACNQFTSSYQLTGEGLSVKAVAATMRACLEPLMQQDQQMFDLLQHLQRFDLDEQGNLLLISSDDRRIVAKPQE